MKKEKKSLFTVEKIFFGQDLQGELVRYIESIAYFTNFKSALEEKVKHTNSFVFPFNCQFHKDRRSLKNIIRVNFHQKAYVS